MSGTANLSDSRGVEGLLRCLSGLPRTIDRAIAEAQSEAMPRIARFELALEEAREEVRDAEHALEDSDDDDARWQEDRLEEARARLSRIESAGDDLFDALGRYRAAASALSRLERETLALARRFIEGRLEALAAYEALRPGGQRPGAAGAREPPPAPGPAAAPGIRAPLAAALPPLPDGYAWIPIADIPPEPNLKWNEGQANRVETGLSTFAEELLPRLREGDLDSGDLLEFDRENGREVDGLLRPDSLANTRDMFFGSEPIAVSLLPGGRLDVTNGCHRIETARGLGWTHIPARLVRRSR